MAGVKMTGALIVLGTLFLAGYIHATGELCGLYLNGKISQEEAQEMKLTVEGCQGPWYSNL